MGVQGWYKVLREQGYVPETSPCCSSSVWRTTSNDVMDRIGTHLERIPNHSELLVDGNGLAFHWHRVAYARHVAQVVSTKRQQQQQPNSSIPRRNASCCVKLNKNTNLTPTQVRRLLPNFMPLSQLSAVVHEFIKTLRDKHHMKITVYWDGNKRRVYKRETDHTRQGRRPEEWANVQEYCETGTLPTANTVCAWEYVFPKNRLFQAQIIHTLDSLHIPSVYCQEEADAVIAKAARSKPLAFILGLDSDFCFFPNVQYIPLNTLDAQGHAVTGVVLRRQALASSIGLASESLMTELALLLGNDYFHPANSTLDVSPPGRHTTEILEFVQNQPACFRVTSMSEDVEETLRFVRALYELDDLDEYPFDDDRGSDNDDDNEEDEAGDKVLHLISSPGPACSGRLSIPPEMPLNRLTVNPLQDASAMDAVLRCLTAYLDLNLDHCLITRKDLDVLGKLPIDSSQDQLVQEGEWRPRWRDVGVAYLVEKLLALVYERKSLVARLLPPCVVFDQHKFHAFLRLERGEKDVLTESGKKDVRGVLKSPVGKASVSKKLFNGTKQTDKVEQIRLPIDEHEDRILDSIRRNRVTIVQGSTGCGKSSRIPVMILKSPPPDPALSKIKLFMSQPRRIAAKGLVERVRSVEPDLRDQIALRMGHGVREYESKTTRAWFVTTGYLVRVMANNVQSLRDVSHLIIDEVHERSVDTDILCLLCRRFLKSNCHVRLILMSATLAAKLYEEYFGAPEPPLVVGAKRFPVREVYLDDIVAERSGFRLPAKVRSSAGNILEECIQMKCQRSPNLRYMEKLCSLVMNLVAAMAEPGSSVLVFVPGMNEIVGISEMIDQMFVPGKHFTCIPVHSDIPFEDQMKVFDRADENECRVILSTNSAESSVTLPTLNHVIDLGLAKQITYNELSHRQMLEPVWISRASATQRAGRTGRIAPGVVFRLYSRECFDRYMTAFEPGEMVRVPLDTVILTLKEMMADDERVSDVLDDCIEPPNMSTIRRSYESLYQSHFISSPDDDCHMTSLGAFALALGIDLRLGSLIGLGIQFGVGREAIQMASIFSFPKNVETKTPWQIPNPMLQSPNEFNEMLRKTFTSKCDFDANLFSEPFSVMNLLWDFDRVSSGKKKDWCWRTGVSFQRISRLSSTVSNVQQRVAMFLSLDPDELSVECPPKSMPEGKIALLRIVQTWVFYDTIIECKFKRPLPSQCIQVPLLSHTDQELDDSILDTVFSKERHDYVLVHPKEIEHKLSFTLNPSASFPEEMQRRALSFAKEKQVALVWTFVHDSSLTVYVSDELAQNGDFSLIIEKVRSILRGPDTLVAKENSNRSKRGITERSCGKWTVSSWTSTTQEKSFQKFSTQDASVPKKKLSSLIRDMIEFVASNPRFSALSIDGSQYHPSKISDQSKVVVVSRGSQAPHISLQDLKDLLSVGGTVEMKTKRKSRSPFIFFPSPTTKDNAETFLQSVKPKSLMLANAPEALRLLSVMASRRRTHHVIVEVDLDDEVEESSHSDRQVEIYPDPKLTKLSFRWTRFGSDNRVFVDENSPVASVSPVNWTGTMYCCCANALEIKGGALKAEGLTLLPLDRLFFLLSKVAFGLLRPDPSDEETLQSCLLWVAQDPNKPVQDDALERIHAAALLHKSFDAGEELVCLASSVKSLLKIFDGVGGTEARLWKSFSKDPFLPNNRKELLSKRNDVTY